MTDSSVRIREKYSIWVRWLHWINFPLLFIMMWSGLLIYWANPAYRPEIPDAWYDALHLDHHLAQGMAFHFAFMWLYAVNGLLYVIYLAVSGEWREIVPQRKSLREALQVTAHDLGAKVPLPPQGKLNAAQRIAYSGVIFLGLVSIVSGLAIYKPVQLSWVKQLIGGYEEARLIHYLVFLAFGLFFIVHVLQVARAGWNNFRGMVAGYEKVEEHD